MMRRLCLVCAVILLAAMAVGGWWLARSPDPRYELTELVFSQRYHRFDAMIREVSANRQLDPMLVKALIWRESRFHPGKLGSSGERGLMQIGPAAASEWAKAEHRDPFTPDDLYDPRRNIEAGTWVLARALKRWGPSVADPLAIALAEYNAGHSRAQRWVAALDKDESADPGGRLKDKDVRAGIAFPATRQYVETIESRYHFYQQRGRF